MKICCLIPVYNESLHIGKVVAGIKERNLNVVVVDDGSSDNSGMIAQGRGAVVIQNPGRNGKGYSLKKGIHFILGEDYDALIIMDGDGQHDPEDIGRFLSVLAADHETRIIVGNRMADTRRMPLLRNITNRFMSGLISLVCKQRIPDTQCGFRLITIPALRQLTLESDGFEIETEILIKACKKKLKVASVPIKTIYEDELSHIHPVRDTIRFVKYFIKEIFWKPS